MILLWFALGIALAFGIARYNQSNKLFWTLLLSFTLGFATTKMLLDVSSSKKVDNDNLTQVCSTQVSSSVLSQVAFYAKTDLNNGDKLVTAQVPVGQSVIPAHYKEVVSASMILGRSRDQPIFKCDYFNTS